MGNVLEVYAVDSSSLHHPLQLKSRFSLFANISDLQAIKNDTFLLITENYDITVLIWVPGNCSLETVAFGMEEESRSRDVCPFVSAFDPVKKLYCNALRRMVKIVDMNEKSPKSYLCHLHEGAITAEVVQMGFISTSTRKRHLLVLSRGTNEKMLLQEYEVHLDSSEIRPVRDQKQTAIDMFAPLPGSCWGYFAFESNGKITYCSGGTEIIVKTDSSTSFETFLFLNKHECILGDIHGNVFRLKISYSSEFLVNSFSLEYVKQFSIPSCFTYVHDDIIFLGSAYGNSQLIKLNPDAAVLGEIQSMGPISDFVLIENEKQRRVVACSGAFETSALAVVKNGIAVDEMATVEVEGVQSVFSLKSSPSSRFHDLLLLSFIGHSELLKVSEAGELESLSVNCLNSNASTLLSRNYGEHIVQVTDRKIRLLSIEGGIPHQELELSHSVMNCCADESCLLLVLDSQTLVKFSYLNGEFREAGSVSQEKEVSCLAMFEDTFAICYWDDAKIHLGSLKTQKISTSIKLESNVVARSVVFARFGYQIYCFIGLADGNVMLYEFKNPSELRFVKQVKCGNTPAFLTFIPGDVPFVIASSDQPVVFSAGKKIKHHRLNYANLITCAALDSNAYKESMILVTSSSISFGSVNFNHRLHVTRIPARRQVRRIAYATSSDHLVVVTSEDEQKFEIDLMNPDTMEVQSSFKLKKDEFVACVEAMKLDGQEYIVVGSGYIEHTNKEPLGGRLLVLRIVKNQLQEVASMDVKGAVYAVKRYSTNRIVCGINSQVHVIHWTRKAQLVPLANIFNFIMVLYLDVQGEYILVGDVMKSMTILRLLSGNTLEVVTKDSGVTWITAVKFINSELVMGADDKKNLIIMKSADTPVLSVAAAVHTGDFINKIRAGNLAEINREVVSCSFVYATVSGRLGSILGISEATYDLLFHLQDTIVQNSRSIGSFSHKAWRNYSSRTRKVPQSNIIDGDLVEGFLDLPDALAKQIIETMNRDRSWNLSMLQVKSLLEDLQRCH